ncbi:EboA domain-containing protein [Cellulomonas sp. GbtcB1]|uniref:EboA domain-containing protein n=1 Tax=Cellulomonas sp. GbtcB1 TaxID=2824746 RepID=UPI0027E09F4A|nr:EboA domain-containing protein [Cellulomonas sp. GbtcB1]
MTPTTSSDPAAPTTAPPASAGATAPGPAPAAAPPPVTAVVAAARAAHAGWLADVLAGVRRDPRTAERAFPMVGRRVGRTPLRPATDPAGVVHGTVDDAARAAVVLALADAHRGDGDRLAAHLADLYREGDTAERRGVLRGLDALEVSEPAALPGPVVALGRDLAADALRANDTSLVAAAVGPFAAAHLDQHTWRHAVVKLVFQGTSLDAVAALDDRADAELARMARDLAAERRAAGRAVPEDLARLTTPAQPGVPARTTETEEP